MSPSSRNEDAAGPLPRVRRAADPLFRAAALVGVVSLFAAGGVTVLDIVLRAFGGAVPGVVDLVQLFVMATAFTAVPYAFFCEGHVSVDILTQAFPPRAQWLLRALAALAAAAVMTLILYYGWQAARQQMRFGDVSQNLGIPMIWYWALLLAGAALSILACVIAAVEAFAALARPARRSPE